MFVKLTKKIDHTLNLKKKMADSVHGIQMRNINYIQNVE